MRKLLWSLVLTLAVASPAAAADEQTLSRERPTATFQGKKGLGYDAGVVTGMISGGGCHSSGVNCETTRVRLTAPGRLTAIADGRGTLAANGSQQVLITKVYEADEQGRAGRLVSEGTGDTAVVADADAGLYLMVVQWSQGAWDYIGRLALEPDPVQ